VDACTPEGGGDLTIILQNFIYYLQIFLDNTQRYSIKTYFELDSLKIDPIIVHLVTMHGPSWSDIPLASDVDSNLRCRALESVAQILDLDLSKDSEKEKAEMMLDQNKEGEFSCLGGGQVSKKVRYVITTQKIVTFHGNPYRTGAPMTLGRDD